MLAPPGIAWFRSHQSEAGGGDVHYRWSSRSLSTVGGDLVQCEEVIGTATWESTTTGLQPDVQKRMQSTFTVQCKLR